MKALLRHSILGATAASTCLAAATATAQQAPQKKPNVLFIIADDLNNDLGCYGHSLVKSPNIDRLAKQGVTFTNAYTNFPLCGPSRACFMTGLYPDQNTMKRLRILIRDRLPDVTTMTQHFMNNGYTAARIGKIYHYDNPKAIGTPGHDDPASWNETVNPRGCDKDEENKIFSLKPGHFGATLSWLASEGKDEEHTDGIVATESIRLMRKYAAEKKPFFLAVGFYKPHTPYVAPKKYFDMYDKSKIKVPKIPDSYYNTIPLAAKKTLMAHKEERNLPEDKAKSAIQAYYACVSFLDAQVGRLLDEVKKLGLEDDTIILFTSDHGYHLGEHGHYQKMTLFQNSDRVPLILYAPGMEASGKTTASMAEMIDFYPTLSDLAGLPKPKMVSGVSLAPILNDPKSQPRTNALTQMINGYTLRTGDYRYTRWVKGGPQNIELYDHRTDPEEMKNLARDPKYADLITKLDKELTQRVQAAQKKPEGLRVIKAAPKGGKKGKGRPKKK